MVGGEDMVDLVVWYEGCVGEGGDDVECLGWGGGDCCFEGLYL